MALYRDSKSKVYYFDFWHRGKRYKRSTHERGIQRARKVMDKFRDSVRWGGQEPVDDIAFDELADKYLETHAAAKRGRGFYEATVNVLREHFGEMMLSNIGTAEVDGFMAERRANVKPATANRSLAVLKHMFKLAVRWRHMRDNPAADVKLEREDNRREFFLTGEQARVLIEETPGWLRPLVILALQTGARQGELLSLTWADVDFGRGVIRFRKTKSGRPRDVRMSETARAVLLAMRGTPQAPVFRNRMGKRLVKSGIGWAFERAVERVGFDGFRFHDLRHSSASFMVQAGVPLNTVREILGHSDLKMTLRYAHLAPDHQADAMAVMDRVANCQEASLAQTSSLRGPLARRRFVPPGRTEHAGLLRQGSDTGRQ